MKIARKLNILSSEVLKKSDAICFTSNGATKKDGKLIMGAGNAKQFRDRFPGLDQEAGTKVKKYGHICQIIQSFHIGTRPLNVLSFPTKYTPWEDSDLELIKKSALEILELANKHDWKLVCIPAPGVSNGNLRWVDVRPVLESVLDDRFVICFWKGKK